MRVLTTKLRVEIENEARVFLESLEIEIEMRVSQKSGLGHNKLFQVVKLLGFLCIVAQDILIFLKLITHHTIKHDPWGLDLFARLWLGGALHLYKTKLMFACNQT